MCLTIKVHQPRSREKQSHDIMSLRNKIQLLGHKLMLAEGRARVAGDEAAYWQLNYKDTERRLEAKVAAAEPSEIEADITVET